MAEDSRKDKAKDGTRDERAPFGLIGHPLGHSWSPQIHDRLGSIPYRLHDLAPDQVADFVRGGGWRGLNVTIPYKAQAAHLADECSERVRRLGVANTLVRRDDGTIYAENTDVLGFGWMLDDFCRQSLGAQAGQLLHDAPVLVLGSGGASHAVQAALAERGARTSVISRKGDDTYETLTQRHADAVLVVNTTPVGMYPKCPASPLSLNQMRQLPKLAGVLDVVYNPTRTGICLNAEKLGIPFRSGLPMLVAQALYSSELFQDQKLERDCIADVVRDILSQTTNVVLIGMPGSGKTSTGKRLAHTLGRPFIDLDEAFKVHHGMTAEKCIRQQGEKRFRELETEVVSMYGARSGLVISCGGGVVTQPRNYDLLHQNGLIVMLDRPIDQLPSDGRPISQDKGVERLARERMPLYRSWADYVQPCTGSPAGDARAIAQHLGW